MESIIHPDRIESVSFSDNILTIRCFCCVYKEDIASQERVRTQVPGRIAIELFAPASKTIGVKISSRRTVPRAKSKVQVPLKSSSGCSVEETATDIIFKNGAFEARIAKTGEFRISYYYCGSPVVAETAGSAFCGTGKGSVSGASLEISPDEHLFGLGPAGASVLRNGTRVKCGIPFIVSSASYGVFVNTTLNSDISVGADGMATTFSVPEDEIEYEIIVGESIMDIFSTYELLAGNRVVPYVPQRGITLKIDNNYKISAEEIMTSIRDLSTIGMPVTELWLGGSWHPSFDRASFMWDIARYQNDELFARALHDAGIKLGLAVTPAISDGSPEYSEVLDCGYLVQDKNGKALVLSTDVGNVGIINLGNLAARNWFTNQCDVLLSRGADFLEADIPAFILKALEENVEDSSFVTAFPGILNTALLECEIRIRGRNCVSVIANSLRAGNQPIPYGNILRTKPADFCSLTQTLRSAVSLGMSGVPEVNIDVPFTSDPALFCRWLGLAMFAPHYRLVMPPEKVTAEYMGQESYDALKSLSGIRSSLLPYIYSAIAEGASFGVPVMRLLESEFPGDVFARGLENEYMLGNALLVAPVMNAEGEVRAYIPSGIWTDLFTYEKIQGPRYINRKADNSTVPVFVRPNTIIATRTPDAAHDHSLLEGLTFTCFALADGQTAVCEVFEHGMAASGILNVTRAGSKITVQAQNFGKRKRIVFAGVNNIVSASESVPEQTGYGTMISFTGNELIVTLG
jgi:alpha-glucosidase (family GH31 glycosyl hydrolase)